MIFKKELPPKESLDGRHGLVVEIHNGTENGARKIARILFEQNCCELEVESIHNPRENIWVFIWPEGSSVQMPAIIQFISMRLMQYCRCLTLREYFQHNK